MSKTLARSEIGEYMRKQRIEYDSPVDALVAISKRLSTHEKLHHMESEAFFHRYGQGEMEDSKDFVEWSNDCQHYLAIKHELER